MRTTISAVVTAESLLAACGGDDESTDTRLNIVIFDGSPPTVEAAQALIGSSVYTFVTIDSFEAGADRYFVSGAGAEQGREDDAGPMSFTILCRN